MLFCYALLVKVRRPSTTQNFQPPVEKCCVQALMISTPQKTFLSLLLRTAATGLHEYTELTPHLYKASRESVLFDSPQLYEQRRRKKRSTAAVQPVKKKGRHSTNPKAGMYSIRVTPYNNRVFFCYAASLPPSPLLALPYISSHHCPSSCTGSRTFGRHAEILPFALGRQ